MSDEITPVNGIQILIHEVREMQEQCRRIADNGMLQNEELPKLKKRIDRVTLFQAWFPTAAISIAIIVRLVFMR